MSARTVPSSALPDGLRTRPLGLDDAEAVAGPVRAGETVERLVRDETGALVGATHVHLAGGGGYVATIGVRRDRRGRGPAAAVLVDL